MNARHVKNSLDGYLDDNLPDDERAYVESHLAVCEDCAAELSYLKRIRHLLQSRVEPAPGLWQDVEARLRQVPSPGLWNGIERRIREESQGIWAQLEWAGRRLVPVVAAAAVVLLAVLHGTGPDNGAVTLEDYVDAQWDAEAPEGVVLTQAVFTQNDIIILTASIAENPSEAR